MTTTTTAKATHDQPTRVGAREPRDSFVSIDAHVKLTAEWVGRIGRVVIDGSRDGRWPLLSMHLDAEYAAQLAADLNRAVTAARASEVTT